MKIGVDFDGVITDFADRIIHAAEWHDEFFLNKNGRDFDVDDDYYVQFDWNIEEAQDFFDQYEVRITEESQVFPFCKNISRKIT